MKRTVVNAMIAACLLLASMSVVSSAVTSDSSAGNEPGLRSYSNYSLPVEYFSASELPVAISETTELPGIETPETINESEFLAANASDEALWASGTCSSDLSIGSEPPEKEPLEVDVSRYTASTHQSIAFEILASEPAADFVDSRWMQTLISYSDDPDDWGLHEDHYLNNPVGTDADERVEEYGNKALVHFGKGELEQGYTDLSYASHFMMDLGCAWHRDIDWRITYHAAYEDWVVDHWYSEDLWESCRFQQPSNYMAMNPGATLADLATECNDRVYPYIDLQYNYINPFQTSPPYSVFLDSVKQTLSYCAQFTAALYAYVAPHAMLLDYVADPYPYAEVHGVGDTEKVAVFTSDSYKIQIHLDLYNSKTYGDLATDYCWVYVYREGGSQKFTFTNLPEANGGWLQYDCVVYNSYYLTKKVTSIEVVWHQWTRGTWFLYSGEGWSTATMDSDGFGATQTSSTYAEAIGKTFGYDSDYRHSLGVLPVTKVRLHLEVTIPETYGDIATDWLYIDRYYTTGGYSRTTFTSLPQANGGTVIFDCEFVVYTSAYAIDYFKIEWHQWTYGQSHGNSWVMGGKTTIYWDTGPPSTYPI